MTKPAPVFTVLCFSLLCIPSLAQESIGFSDSTDFQYIIDYRLPDWGYSNFNIQDASFGTNGEFYWGEENKKNATAQRVLTENITEYRGRTQLNFIPGYQYYRESELKTIDLRMNLSVNTSSRNIDYDVNRKASENGNLDTLDYDVEQEITNSGLGYIINYSGKYFWAGDFFFLSSIDANLGYQFQKHDRRHTEQTPQEIYYTEIERQLDLYPEIGIGFGRLRNVSPQLRALRMNERYKSVGNNSLKQNEIIDAAEQFTKTRGYQRTYDRHEKYFWGDMNQLLDGNLDKLSAFDLFYLTDVLNENLGQRFEGFETFLSTAFHYQNQLEKVDRTQDGIDSDERNLDITKNILATAQVRYYKNLNLNHQLSFETSNEFRFPLESDFSTEWILTSFSDVSWLWTITDRYLLTTSLSNRIYKPKFKPRFNDSDQYNTETYISSQMSYFIENKLALTARASLGLDTFDIDSFERVAKRHSINWALSAGIRYYFNRKLY